MLKRCIASVADQAGVTAHHHVQDGRSNDGTVDFLCEYSSQIEARKADGQLEGYSFSFESAPDEGMYDAVNRGWRRAEPDTQVVAYLNCDEQYLPDTLLNVSRWFAAHPRKDVLFGSVLVTDTEGKLVCCRKVVAPRKWHIMTNHLPIFTAATFIRLGAVKNNGLFFDPEWKVLGDADWFVRMQEKKVRGGVCGDYLAVFSDRADIMSLSGRALDEQKKLFMMAPVWVRLLRGAWLARHRISKWISGAYRQKPFSYSIYCAEEMQRRTIRVVHPEMRWLSRLGEK